MRTIKNCLHFKNILSYPLVNGGNVIHMIKKFSRFEKFWNGFQTKLVYDTY